MKKRDIKISITDFKYLLFYFVLMEPRYFYYVPGIEQLFKVLILIITFYLLLNYFTIKRYQSKITLLIIVYHIYLVLITFVRHGDIQTAIVDSCIFCGLSIATVIVIKTRPQLFYKQLPLLLGIEVLINLISMIVFPSGLYETIYFTRNYFLGYDNQMINIFIPAVFFSYLAVLYDKKTYMIKFIIISGIVCVSIVRIWSGASLVIMTIILGGILTKVIDRVRIFNMLNYFLVNIGCFVLMVLLRLQNYFEYFIVIILGKSLTLTGRVYIWDAAMEYIKRNPLWGYGIEGQLARSSKMYIRSDSIRAFAGLHAHDRFLETAYRGGLVLTVIYLAILLIVVYYLMKYKEYSCAKVLAIVIFAYLTGMITEFYRLSYMFFPFMVIAENIDRLEDSLVRTAKKDQHT